MRKIFTYGSVGRAPGNRCLYPEADAKSRAAEKRRSSLPSKDIRQRFKAYLQLFGLTSCLFGYTLYINKFWRYDYAE